MYCCRSATTAGPDAGATILTERTFSSPVVDFQTWDRHMPATSPTSLPTSPLTSNASSHATWTDERIELLKSHFAAGLTCREIAADIGVSRNAVIGKLSRLNLTRGRTIDDRKVQDRPARTPRAVPRL